MDVPLPIDSDLPVVGPCTCGSALPHRLCCGARTLTGQSRLAVFAQHEDADAAGEEWDLAITTVHALAAVLPDVPVPLLGGKTPRDLYRAGREERAAALDFVQAVARSAEAMGMHFPADSIAHAIASPEAPADSREDREKITLATFTLHLLARGVETPAILGGQRLFRDLMRTLSPDLDHPAAYAAAIDYAVCWMHFRPEANEEYPEGRREVACLYDVRPEVVADHFSAMKQALKLVWFDPRYAVHDSAWQERLEATGRALAEGEDENLPDD